MVDFLRKPPAFSYPFSPLSPLSPFPIYQQPSHPTTQLPSHPASFHLLLLFLLLLLLLSLFHLPSSPSTSPPSHFFILIRNQERKKRVSSRLISRDSEREGGWSDQDGRVALRKEARVEGGREGGIGVEADERKRSSGWKVNEWGYIKP